MTTKRLTAENDGFITKWLEKYNLQGWPIKLNSAGSLALLIHKLGWLTRAVYIKVPKKEGSNEVPLRVCVDNDVDRNNPNKIIDVN